MKVTSKILLGFLILLTLFLGCGGQEKPRIEVPPNLSQVQPVDTVGQEYVHSENQPKVIGGPSALYNALRYPMGARQAGLEGDVFLQFIVEKDGSPSNITVIKGAESESLNQAAIEALESVRFEPATLKGEPVRVYMTQKIVFKLR